MFSVVYEDEETDRRVFSGKDISAGIRNGLNVWAVSFFSCWGFNYLGTFL